MDTLKNKHESEGFKYIRWTEDEIKNFLQNLLVSVFSGNYPPTYG